MGLFKRGRPKRQSDPPLGDDSPWTRNSYVGFLIGLVDRPSRKQPDEKSSKR